MALSKSIYGPDTELWPLDSLTVIKLKAELDGAGVAYKSKALKAELQARWALHKLGHHDVAQETSLEDLDGIITWCKMTDEQTRQELEDFNLPAKKYKWQRVQVLIQASYGTRLNDIADVGSGIANMGLKDDPDSKQPAPSAVNLSIAMVCAEAARTQGFKSLPYFPTDSLDTLKTHSDKFPQFKTSKELTKALESPLHASSMILAWICDSVASKIVPATGDLFIEGMPSRVEQFVVAEQDPTAQTQFDKMQRSNPGSNLVFHGTDISNVVSILHNGFKPALASYGARSGGVWMAQDPEYSWSFATRWIDVHAGNASSWTNSSYKRCGILLGCELAGSLSKQRTQVVKDLRSVIVRYIFVLPVGKAGITASSAPPPARKIVEDDMIAAFKIIKAGIPSLAKTGNVASGSGQYANQPDHTVVNLSINMLASTQMLPAALPGLPANSLANRNKQLSNIPRFNTAKALNTALETSSQESRKMLRWICDNIGKDIVPAVGNLKIAAFPGSVHQFVVVNHLPKLQNAFDKHMSESSSKSMLLYHGTSFLALLSILRNGFTASRDLRFGRGIFLIAGDEYADYADPTDMPSMHAANEQFFAAFKQIRAGNFWSKMSNVGSSSK